MHNKIILFGIPDMQDLGVASLEYQLGDSKIYLSKSERRQLKHNRATLPWYEIKDARTHEILYNSQNSHYRTIQEKIVKIANQYDIFVSLAYPIVHPLYLQQIKSYKVLGLIDDPYTLLARTLPFFKFYDHLVHVTKSTEFCVDYGQWIQDNLNIKASWFPLITYNIKKLEKTLPGVSPKRNDQLLYVGSYYRQKLDLLSKLNSELGPNFRLYGKWPMRGYSSVAANILFGLNLPFRVATINQYNKLIQMKACGLALNFHFDKFVSGNMRTFELAATATPQLALLDANHKMKEILDDTECIYAESEDELVELSKYYLQNPRSALSYGINAEKRFKSEYTLSHLKQKFERIL